MKLPDKIESTNVVYPLTLPINGLEITFKPFTLEQEKGLILGKEHSTQALIENYFNIAKNSIVSVNGEKEFHAENTMSKINTIIDFVYFHLNLRGKSETEIINMEMKCENEECKERFDFEHNIIESLKIKNKENKTIIFKISDFLTLKLKPLPISFLEFFDELEEFEKSIKSKKIEEIEESEYLEKRLEYYKKILAYSIDSVIYKDKIYNDFTVDELNNKIIKTLSYGELIKGFEKISTLIKMYMEFNLTCPKCKHKMIKQEENFLKFLT